MNNQEILIKRWKKTRLELGEYLKKYKKLNKKTQDSIQAAFDSINIKPDELNKIISVNEKERLKRKISEWEDKGLLTGYFSYLVNNLIKKSITYNDMLDILLYGCFIEERATLDEYDNILFQSISQELYNQGIDEIRPKNKDKLNLTDAMLISFLAIPIDGVIWVDYVQALALTNYQEIKKIAVDNISQKKENHIDDDIFQRQLQKQRNRLICITDNGISGRLDLQTTVIGNLSYLQAGINYDTSYIKFVSDLCENVTKMCSNMDGIIFDINGDNKFHRWYGQDYKSLKYEEIECFGLVPGINLPPIFHHFHWCHSTMTYKTELSTDEIRKLMKNGNIRDEQPIEKFINKIKQKDILGVSDKSEDSGLRSKVIGYIDEKDIPKLLNYYENKIKSRKNEYSIIVQKDGKVIQCTGSATNVELTGNFNGAIITHNHPSNEPELGGSFGKDDWEFLSHNQKVKELRAVDSQYIYSLKLLKDTSNISYNDIYKSVLNPYADSDYKHLTMLVAKERGLIEYERRKI